MKRYPILTFLLLIIALLWVYAKDRKTKAELLADDPMIEDFTDVFADPHIKKTIEDHNEWIQTEEGQLFKQKITQRQIEYAIELALEKIRD